MSKIYIFGKGMREGYRGNILKTMALPENLHIRYSYNKSRNVFHDTRAFVKGTQCIFCFIDTSNAKRYQFYPLREGVLESCIEENGRLEVTIKVGRYLSIDETKIPEFTSFIESSALPQLKQRPHLTPNGPNDHNDGSYVSVSDLNEDFQELQSGTNYEWKKTVKYLSKTLFADNKNTIYFKIDRINYVDSGKIIPLSLISGLQFYECGLYEKIRISLTYLNPYIEESEVSYLVLREEDYVKRFGNNKLAINTYHRTESLCVSTIHEGETVLIIEPQEGNVPGALVELPLKITKERIFKSSILPIILFALSYSAFTFISKGKEFKANDLLLPFLYLMQMLSIVWLSFLWKGKIPFFK